MIATRFLENEESSRGLAPVIVALIGYFYPHGRN